MIDLDIDNPYFECMLNRIYPPELQLMCLIPGARFIFIFYLHLSTSNGFVSSRIYDKPDDFDFDVVKFLFLNGDVPRTTSYGVYIPRLI